VKLLYVKYLALTRNQLLDASCYNLRIFSFRKDDMRRLYLATATFLLLSNTLFAQTPDAQQSISQEELETCLSSSVVNAEDTMTVQALKNACRLLDTQIQQAELPLVEEEIKSQAIQKKDDEVRPLLIDRMTMEALNRANRFVLTPHNRNYILPITYKDSPYSEPYEAADSTLQTLDHTEVEFQLSIKLLLRGGLFGDNGHLYLGYTNHSLWQFYNSDLSKPFRETNHEPELILSFTNDWEIWGFRNVLNEAIINHQSNGQSGLLSRSWNRIMLNSVFEKDRFVFAFTPWYRIPESEAEYPGDPHGDDNPDIEKYMGNFELSGAYQRKKDIFSVMLRNNLRSNNKGAIELGWSFPLSRRMPNMRGYVKYFNGYGQSLIDYDDSAEVIGLGIVLTDLF
jgi:phospholipase A1